MPLTVACARRRSRISAATSGPLDSRTESSDSSHSWISTSSIPWGWVDISLSIASVGSSSFAFQYVLRQARQIYARDKENRIHRGANLCTAGIRIFREAAEISTLEWTLQHPPAIHDEDLTGNEFRMDKERNGFGDIFGCAQAAEWGELDEVLFPSRRVARASNRTWSN